MFHLIFFDNGPEPIVVRVIGRPFVHDRSGPVGQGPVNDVAVTRHPANVGRRPVGVLVLGDRRCSDEWQPSPPDSHRWCGEGPWACRSFPTCTVCRGDARSRDGQAPQEFPPDRFISSCHQWSRSSTIGTSGAWLVRLTTRTFSMVGQLLSASSALPLRGTTPPLRQAPSAVISNVAWQSLMRSLRDSGLKPPNTTVWGAPRRAQASIAIASSGIIPR